MCLILFAWKTHQDYPMVMAANRDEFYARPTQASHFWPDAPDMLAGKDLEAGGTWMGITRQGRFAAVTNYREPGVEVENPRSRGDLVSDFLQSVASPAEYLSSIEQEAMSFRGFNLLVGDGDTLWYFSNRSDQAPKALVPGVYGLCNHLLDTPWPKVAYGKSAIQEIVAKPAVDEKAMMSIMARTDRWPDEAIPRTGVSIEWERLLSSIHIASSSYGTCSSTTLLVSGNGDVHWREKSRRSEGLWGEQSIQFAIEP